MQSSLLEIWCAIVVSGWCVAFVSSASAQQPPVNSTLVGTWDGYAGTYGDIWGEGDFGYVGSFTPFDGMAARVHILDITDPANPSVANIFFLPGANQFRSPQDVKVANGILFVGLEGGGTDDVLIADVRDPTSPVVLTTIQLPGIGGIHNVFFKDGFLYICDSSTRQVGIVDFRNFDPDNPPVSPITSARWIIQNIGNPGGGNFVHDITVAGGRLYAAAWNSGLQIYDVSDVANTMPTLIGSAPGTSTHAMWPTDDGAFVVVGEERSNGGIKVFSITEDLGLLSLNQTDSLSLPVEAFSTHNQVVVDHRVYVSWYQAGLQVLDINPVTGQLEFVASYDTSVFDNSGGNAGFSGNWGVYPFLGSDRILLSDEQEGFFVVSVQGPALGFDYPDGLVDLVHPDGGTTIRVNITAQGAQPDPATAELLIQTDGGPFTAIPMSFDGAVFTGVFPATACLSEIGYYISVNTLGGQPITDPQDAPASVFTALSGAGIVTAASFDFENNTGWSVSGDAVAGIWETGIPAGDGSRGDPVSDFDGSGQCYLTENLLGNSDVDGGVTRLLSPSFDLSSMVDPFVDYARWYSNSSGASPAADIFEVEISDNGGVDWLALETVGPAGPEVGGGWFAQRFRVADFVGITSAVRFRFSVSDAGAGSVVEAGLDAFSIFDIDCGGPPVGPSITGQPQGATVCEGESASMSVSASGSPPLSFQWRVDGIDISGATQSTFTLKIASGGDEGLYRCLVTNAAGSIESDAAMLSVVTPIECEDTDDCTVDGCSGGGCVRTAATPLTQEESSRRIAVTPDSSCTGVVALRITSPDFPCLDSFVDVDGSLVEVPVLQTVGAWGTVHVRDEFIVPSATYVVETQLVGGERSTPVSVVTWLWGDVDGNTVPNLVDAQAIVQVFQGNTKNATPEAADIHPCTPNDVVNLIDAQKVVKAFQDESFVDSGCGLPCQ